jgi:thiamine biosynthesis lipoprotein
MSPEPPHRFRAMDMEVIAGGAGAAHAAAIEALFAERERVFSRFRPHSELALVNATRAPLVVVSPLFARTLRAALAAAAATDGLVDPTLGAALEAAGYDRDFARVVPDASPEGPAAPGRRRSVRVVGRVVARPPGLRLDLNGVVKALAIDDALALFDGPGFVSAGGDVAVRGGAVVGLPRGGSVRVEDGGVATSGTTHRRWLRGGAVQHHLIDARTGRPASSRWSEVTVVAPTCLDADVAAKAAFLLSDDGPGWLDERGLAGRFLAGDVVVTNRAWRERLQEAA